MHWLWCYTHRWGCKKDIHVQNHWCACVCIRPCPSTPWENMTICTPPPHTLSSSTLYAWSGGLSSVSVTQYQCPCSLIALTEPGLTHKDRLSHVAGDAPLACCLSLYLTAVSWMQPDKGLRRRCKCPFLSMTPDVRVQEHYSCYSCSGRLIPRFDVELHLWPVGLRERGLISGFAGFSSSFSLMNYQHDQNGK